MKKIFVLLALCLLFVSCTNEKKEENYDAALDEAVEKYDGVFEANDGTLISLYAHHEESAYTDDYKAIGDFSDKCTVPVYVAFPPRKMDALTTLLPSDFPIGHSEYLYRLAEKTLAKSSAVYIDLYSALCGSEGTYFMTDHHWTHKGAYLAYEKIVSAMGKTPYQKVWFETELLIEDFKGSDHTKRPESEALDSVTGAYPKGNFTVENVAYPYDTSENNTVIEGFFDYSRLGSYEPYAVLLGGNNPYVRVKGEGERECLVVLRDSFANAIAPYLAAHFDLVLVDPRFYPDGISGVVERENAVAVLVLENMGSITESEIKIKW